MHNVGFGDAFLLFIPTSKGEKTMLVDCGVHPSGVRNAMSKIVPEIINSVTKNGKARIDIVVATHRHADHISGFAVKKWQDVEVGEVWLPWTEERGNPAADKIRKAQHRLASALAAKFADDPRIGFLALNSLSNKDAEDMLLGGFQGDPEVRYLPAVERSKRTFRTPLLPGVKVHALGPTHDAELIATLDPPKGKHFLRGTRAAADEDEDDPATPADAEDELPPPLFPRFELTPAEYRRHHSKLAESLTDAAILRERAATDWLGAAASLEDAINGTSLVLVLEIGNLCVLLAGDAEWGTWSEVLEDEQWRDLLARTSLYKVSHHGSFNGTPKEFVDDLLPAHALSLVSLTHMDIWPSIPRRPLFTALKSKHRTLIQTNHLPPASTSVKRNGTLWVEVALPIKA
jgi:beta-lactamase superfamily II metal-dependent hydrolase